MCTPSASFFHYFLSVHHLYIFYAVKPYIIIIIIIIIKDGATPDSRFKCLWTYKIHHQAKYQRLNANTLYVAAILFSRSTLHREALPCLPNTLNNDTEMTDAFYMPSLLEI